MEPIGGQSSERIARLDPKGDRFLLRLDYISFFSVSQASFDAGLADLSGEEYDVHAVTGSLLYYTTIVSWFRQ